MNTESLLGFLQLSTSSYVTGFIIMYTSRRRPILYSNIIKRLELYTVIVWM